MWPPDITTVVGSAVCLRRHAVLCYEPAINDVYKFFFFFFQAEDGIRDLVRSRGLGDVYKRQDYRGI